jgi:hypothetical protein
VVLNKVQNYYAAHGSSASIEDIVNFALANVEILQDVTRDMTDWLGFNDPHRNKTEVDSRADILALCLSLKTSNVHVLTANWLVQAPETKQRKAAKDPKVMKDRQSAVKDVMKVGRQRLGDKGGYSSWLKRSLAGHTSQDADEADEEQDGDEEFD